MPRPLAFDPTEALERATETFWQQGYEATSLDDLTQAMGINRPSLYNHFGDKRSLYLQALKHYRDQHGAATARTLNEARNVRAGFRRVFEGLVHAENACWGCFVVNAATELGQEVKEVRAFVGAAAEATEQLFADAVRLGQERGEIGGDKDPLTLAKLLYNGMLAIRVRSRSGATPQDLQEHVELTLALLD